MVHRDASFQARLLCGVAVVAIAGAGSAAAQDRSRITIEPQPLVSALNAFGAQTGQPVISTPELTGAKQSPGVRGAEDPGLALTQLLAGTGLSFRCSGDTYLIVPSPEAGPAPTRCVAQSGAGGSEGGVGSEVEALIVTAQKREEDIQDVPIAISAFSQEALERSQVAGGPDLITQVPNMTFTKTNFSSYSIQIRGIGTQAISATTDPAVAVAFNNTPFIHNRFFEQEFYDLQRVEVLRGPQGTLYGRNATAGVVNLISAKPKFAYEAKLSGDIGNYNSTRLEGMVNVPLVEDMVALRLAGAWTKRDGYAINAFTGNPIDGRDLWSTRLSLRFTPSDAVDVNFIWEHFEEDDDRIRSGKQLCKKDTHNSIAGVPFPFEAEPGINQSVSATYNQGCVAASLYAPESFQTPNGFSLPYIHPLKQLGLPATTGLDPYASQIQSRDLRVIESLVDPQYRAQSDIAELQVSWDISDNLTLQSETAYNADDVFSTQDYNRFITSTGIFSQSQYDCYSQSIGCGIGLGQAKGVVNDGVFCDPQIGCSDRLVAVDLSTAQSRQFNQELRLSSDFDGPFNFSVGVNFARFDTLNKYYVFINSLSLWSALRDRHNELEPVWPVYQPGVSTNFECLGWKPYFGNPSGVYGVSGCIYMDPNPIGALNDQGHNYFLSKNPYRLISYAGFGEIYYNITGDLKITAGLRYTVDKKHAPLIPSWLLAARTIGYPVKEILDLEWNEPTGRLAIDWKPDLTFTDETLLYASYAHGYKAGGVNPPPMVVVLADSDGKERADLSDSVLHPKTFDAEFVDAFEIGAKNTFLDGHLTLNANVFYYDYTGYQISQIIDRSAVNSNFDAEIWGAEIEAEWRPLENLKFGFKGGYENTRLADGSQAIDLMDRTAGDPDWVVAKPFPSMASNCILPASMVTFGNRINTVGPDGSIGDQGFCLWAYVNKVDPVTQLPYVADPTERKGAGGVGPILPGDPWFGYAGFNPESAPNGGAGIDKDLSGNELPNAPNFTGTLTADYTLPLRGDWVVTLHGDLYYQSEAWTRIFNMEGYDKLKAYTTVNLAAIFTNEEAGWRVMAYIKNVMDRDAITGSFLNSDDTGLTTNVFLTEPRLYGVRLTKEFTDVPLLGSLFGERLPAGQDYPLTVEIAGGTARFSADTESYAPEFLELYSDEFPRPLFADQNDLDWGDTRQVKLTYRPMDGWSASAAYRFGKTNGSARGAGYEFVPGTLVAPAYSYAESPPNHWVSTVTDQEQYDIVEFLVGKDFGLGILGDGGRSQIGAGLRYADFRSTSDIFMDGSPDRYVPERSSPTQKYGLPRLHHTQYTYSLDVERGFEGYGPFLSWDASLRLFGDDERGHGDLDWSVGGGALFGKQTVDSVEDRLGRYFQVDLVTGGQFATSFPVDETISRSRSENVTVPTLSLELGVSYAVDRVKVSTGYSYDRFFDAIDGGFEESQQYDRTIHGPYLKLSLGFGG